MNIQVIIPLVIFLLLFFIVGLLASRYIKSTDSFIQEYFLGSRQMGGFILAMTMVATYGSGSSFIGGPGAAYNYGLAWVLLAMTQVVTGYFVLMVLGKKFAIISRKYNAITLIDFLKARYQSNWVTIIAAISIVIFLFSSMIAQWVGGARLMESINIRCFLHDCIIYFCCICTHLCYYWGIPCRCYNRYSPRNRHAWRNNSIISRYFNCRWRY